MKYFVCVMCLLVCRPVFAQVACPARHLADEVMMLRLYGDDTAMSVRATNFGFSWKGLLRLWYNTGDARYFWYVQRQADSLVDKDGRIRGYRPQDLLPCGTTFLLLYRITGQEKYARAAASLYREKDDPSWSQRDGLIDPFFTQYAALFHQDILFDAIFRQFAATDSLIAGFGPNVRTLYSTALMDALYYFPVSHPGRRTLCRFLEQYAAYIGDQPDTGVSPVTRCLSVYILAGASARNFLPASASVTAKKEFEALREYISRDSAGQQPQLSPFLLLATNEMDVMAGLAAGKGKTVLLDYYFNKKAHGYHWHTCPLSLYLGGHEQRRLFSFWATFSG